MRKIILTILTSISLIAFVASPLFWKFLAGANKIFADFGAISLQGITPEISFMIVCVIVLLIVSAIAAF